jgi:hypothetical protein
MAEAQSPQASQSPLTADALPTLSIGDVKIHWQPLPASERDRYFFAFGQNVPWVNTYDLGRCLLAFDLPALNSAFLRTPPDKRAHVRIFRIHVEDVTDQFPKPCAKGPPW